MVCRFLRADMRQEPGYDEQLSVQDNLRFLAKAQQLPATDIDDMLEMCDLKMLRSLLPWQLQTGARRRLSLAVAAISAPDVLLLDRPARGLDTVPARKLWAAINRLPTPCVIMASGSAAECTAVCTSVAIVVDGRLAALGPLPKLFQRFTQSYTVDIITSASSKPGASGLASLYSRGCSAVVQCGIGRSDAAESDLDAQRSPRSRTLSASVHR